MLPLFILPLSDDQEKLLTARVPKTGLVLSSAGPVDAKTAKDLYDQRKNSVGEVGQVCAPLVMDQWPKTEEECFQVLCSEPKTVIEWRKRNFMMLAMAKSMVFVADDKVSASQELLTLLTVARIVRAKTVGIIPEGAVPFPVPSTILAAADLVLSGEADGDTTQRVLRSLTEEG